MSIKKDKLIEISIQEVKKQLGEEYKTYKKDLIQIQIQNTDVLLTKQITGYGHKYFLICPQCSERRTKLYLLVTEDHKNIYSQKIYCRTCSPISPYKDRQNSTEGGTRELHYRMDKLAQRYNIKFEYPFNYKAVKRPKYHSIRKWQNIIKKLQILENMRMGSIYFDMKFKSKLIKYILDNHTLVKYDLRYIEKYILNWEKIAKDIKQEKRRK